MSFPRYPEYRPSDLEWLGDLPSHWSLRRLKQVCSVFPSNVDKKSYEGELPIRLCNYTDVYYNDEITDGLEFMSATASQEQVSRFELRADDVLVTKDSETADDIAVSAHVPKALPGVVCGYHLALIRPRIGCDGRYIKRLFDSRFLKSCVAVEANGLTRVGLSQYALDNLPIPVASREEQGIIASFLARETAKIDALVAEQEKLIELLKEKRQAVISHSVTKGLNPDAPMRASGVEWLGDLPSHWQIVGLTKYMGSIVDYRGRTPTKVDEGVLLLTAKNITDGKIDYAASAEYIDRAEYAQVMSRGLPQEGDVLQFINDGRPRA